MREHLKRRISDNVGLLLYVEMLTKFGIYMDGLMG